MWNRSLIVRATALVLVLASLAGTLTACGAGATSGALIGAGIGAAIGSTYDDPYYYDPYYDPYYYKAEPADYENAW